MVTQRSRSPKKTQSEGKRREPTKHAAPGKTKSAPATSSGIMSKVMDDLLGTAHADTAEFEQAIQRCIPSEFLLIASQDDKTQAQEDYFAVDHFHLAKHVPKFVQKSNAGSVATCALLQLMYENPNLFVADAVPPGQEPINCLQLSREIKRRVKVATKLDAHPTISSSRPLGPSRLDRAPPFYIVPPGHTGTRRALLIGVVKGEGPDLKGPPNDVTNIRQFLTQHCGFLPENIAVLQDYLKHNGGGDSHLSTKENILRGFATIVRQSKPNDVCFIQFSGHGGRTGNSLYILPSDYDTAGQIMDQDLLRDLIKRMPSKVHTTMLVDCCYSGTVGDLPYVLQHNSSHGKQEIDPYYDTDRRRDMIQKEKEGGERYQLYKQARSERRLTNRLEVVYDFVATAAQAGYDATAWAAQSGYDVAKGAYDATGQIATAGLEATAQAATATYDATAKTAAATYDVTAKTAAEAYEVTAKTAAEAYDVTTKTAAATYDVTAKKAAATYDVTAKTAAATYDVTAKTAAEAAKKAEEAATYTGRRAVNVLKTSSRGATDAGRSAVTVLKTTSREATDAVTKGGAAAIDKVGKKAEEAATYTGRKATTVLKTTSKGATDAGKKATDAGKKAADAVTKGGAAAIDTVKSVLPRMSGSSKDPTDDAGGSRSSAFSMSALTSAANAAAFAANTAGSTLRKTAGSVTSSVKGKSGNEK